MPPSAIVSASLDADDPYAREAQTVPTLSPEPNTGWLDDCLELDKQGFVCTVAGAPYEASLPGIFAVGDVRAGSTKRVSSSVGEGSVVVSSVHKYLEAQRAAGVSR